MKHHPSVTLKRVQSAVARQRYTLENPGICLACGAERGGCEPDARNYACHSCGEDEVFGAEELLMTLVF